MKKKNIYLSILFSLSLLLGQFLPIYAQDEEEIPEEVEIVEEVETEEEETSEEECLLNYLYVDMPVVKQNEEQSIVVSMSQEVDVIELQGSVQGESFTLQSTKHVSSFYEFKSVMKQEGNYSLETLRFVQDEKETILNLQQIGIQASFEVENVQMENLPVASVEENSKGEIEGAIEEALTQMDEEEITLNGEGKGELTVCLDPGHGAEDSGAVSVYGTYEKTYTLKVATFLKQFLEEYEKVHVVMTRYDDSINPSLSERAQIAAQHGADLFVSIHFNAYNGTMRGAEVYYPNANYRPDLGEQGKAVAANIEKELIGLGLTNRGIKIRVIDQYDPEWRDYAYPDGSYADYYGVIRHCKKLGIPGIIVEHCFIDNRNDFDAYMNSDDKLISLAQADCQGIVETYGLVKKGMNNNVLEGYSLSLDGRIGLNFYMSLKSSVQEDTNAYLEFTLPDGTISKTYVKEARQVEVDGKNHYVFPCFVSAKNMASTIQAKLVTSKDPEEIYSFSVKEYASYILNHENQYDTKDVEITKALLNYGASAQQYFQYETKNLPTVIQPIGNIDVSSYNQKVISNDPSISFVGARLILKSTLGMKLYFKGSGDFKIDSKTINTTSEGQYTVLMLEDINPVLLDHTYTITCKNFAMKYSPLSFVQAAQKNENTDLVQLTRALYDYYLKLNKKGSVPLSVIYSPEGYTYIMGDSHVSVAQMVDYYNAHTSGFDTFRDTAYNGIYAKEGISSIEQFCQIFMEEARAEGVNVEVAFVQSMLETGWLKYGGDVKPDQFNFGGLGATGGVPGNSFESIRMGIRAQIQHLKCYASEEALNNPCVDPRWWDALRGKAQYVEYLQASNNPSGYGWSTGSTYAQSLLSMLQQLRG
ncbi:MAG: N-acetylmuramoyl-L-alanine amidase [Firmicutes bacterium]|nr:N-acetylmuramoyl-L-alanine amidase [Bacillota bacterium]